MPAARRKNARRRKLHGRQLQIGTTARRHRAEQAAIAKLEERDDIRASIDRARAAAARTTSPALAAKLDEAWKEFRQGVDKLKAAIAKRRKKLDEQYGADLRALGFDYDKARRNLERKLDERREWILRTHVDEDAA